MNPHRVVRGDRAVEKRPFLFAGILLLQSTEDLPLFPEPEDFVLSLQKPGIINASKHERTLSKSKGTTRKREAITLTDPAKLVSLAGGPVCLKSKSRTAELSADSAGPFSISSGKNAKRRRTDVPLPAAAKWQHLRRIQAGPVPQDRRRNRDQTPADRLDHQSFRANAGSSRRTRPVSALVCSVPERTRSPTRGTRSS
jgi:hypothetical protein